MLGELIEADADAGRLLACTLYARSGARADPIYVHAKIADRRRPLAHDRLGEPERALALQRHRDEHRHPRPASSPRRPGCGSGRSTSSSRSTGSPRDPTEAIDELWKPISAEQLERRNQGQPLTHRLVRLPHVSRRSGRALGPLSGLLVDG